MVFDRNDDEYGNLQKGVVGVNAYNRVYMSLNNYYNTMNYERRQDKKIRQDFDFQVLTCILILQKRGRLGDTFPVIHKQKFLFTRPVKKTM